MKPNRMSLANIQGKMSRAEMKKIMAGSGDDSAKCPSDCSGSCTLSGGTSGSCRWNTAQTKCSCVGAS